MDFRVEGASCVACLMRTGNELRGAKGVIKADVSIYRPYWAIVIYDASQTNRNADSAKRRANIRRYYSSGNRRASPSRMLMLVGFQQ